MQLFQMMGFGDWYLGNFKQRFPNSEHLSFQERQQLLLGDRYGAAHMLKPVYDNDPSCFFTVCDDPILQNAWARENGIPQGDLTSILLAQIEAHETEVLYNNHPIGYPSSFVRQLPSSVKKAIAWRAAPPGTADLSAYDAVVSNFHSLNAQWKSKGWQSAYFSPSWDPEMSAYADNNDRPNDIFFTGSYSRTTGHDDRLDFLNSVASLGGDLKIDLHLMYRKWGRLADKAPWRWVPIPIKLPEKLSSIVKPPLFGREMYQALSQAKIIINPATDIAGDERGNMRCWEALGCGACMISSVGNYPEGFVPGKHFETFTDTQDLIQKIYALLADENRRLAIAKSGTAMVKQRWSKEKQWNIFEKLIQSI